MKPSENPRPNGHDPLEERLSQTTFRQPPAAWRDEILSVAADARRRSADALPEPRLVTSSATISWAQQLVAWLRGIPTEWTAAAALWVLIVGVNYASSPGGSMDSAVSSNLADSSPEQREESIQQALAFRRQLLGELQGTDALDDLPRAARPEAARPKRQLNSFGTNGLAATSA